MTAPAELCGDASHELQLRRSIAPNAQEHTFTTASGPSTCEWKIDALIEGTYDAVILRRDDDRIVATAPKTEVFRGATLLMRLELATIEVEGRITVNGTVPQDARLVFLQANPPFDQWDIVLDDEGTYRIRLEGGDSTQFCMRLKAARTQSIGSIAAGCETFDRGLRRYDADVPVLPGVIRVEVVPYAKPVSNDWTSLIVMVESARSSAGSVGFKATAGFRGEYRGVEDGEYDVRVQTVPAHRVLASSRVTVSPKQPVGRPAGPASRFADLPRRLVERLLRLRRCVQA